MRVKSTGHRVVIYLDNRQEIEQFHSSEAFIAALRHLVDRETEQHEIMRVQVFQAEENRKAKLPEKPRFPPIGEK